MSKLQDLAAGLAMRLADTGLRVYTWMPDRLPPEEAAAVVGFPERIEYDQTMRPSKTKWLFPVTVYAGRIDSQQAQATLAPYVDDGDPHSVKAAIEADPELGGVADTCLVLTADRFGAYEVNGVPYLGCTVNVEVWTSG